MEIMIVDDDRAFIDYIREALQQIGHTVCQANNVHVALLEIENREPDLFLIDVMMPGRDGIYLCEELRANPRFVETPIIMMTGISMNDAIIDRAFDSGADDFIAKPVNIKTLERRIDLLEYKKSQTHEKDEKK